MNTCLVLRSGVFCVAPVYAVGKHDSHWSFIIVWHAGVRCMRCEWTSAEDLACVKDAGPAGGFDLLLGADVCYGQAALPAVRQQVQWLLCRQRFCLCAQQKQQQDQCLDCLCKPRRCSVLLQR